MNVAGLQFLPPSAFFCCAVSAHALRGTARVRNGFDRSLFVVSPAYRSGYERKQSVISPYGSAIARSSASKP